MMLVGSVVKLKEEEKKISWPSCGCMHVGVGTGLSGLLPYPDQ